MESKNIKNAACPRPEATMIFVNREISIQDNGLVT